MRSLLAVLAVIVVMAGAVAAPPPLPVYTDASAGFSIGRPAGWKLSYYDGSIVETKDPEQLIGVLVFPARVQTDLSAEAFLEQFAAAIGGVVEEAGGTFRLTQRKPGEAVALLSVDGADLKAPLRVERQPGFVTLKAYFAPVARFEQEAPALRRVLASFQRTTLIGEKASPPMRAWQGRWFRALVPAGWSVTGETDRGVDLAPGDGSATVSFAFVSGVGGAPGSLLEQTLPGIVPDARVLKAMELPSPSAGWASVAAEFEGTLGGRPVHGVYTVTSSGFGFMSGLRACAAASWDARKLLLGRVLEGVRITSTSGPSSQGVMLPRNNPLDDSTIMSSWNARNESQDRTSQAWSNATLGVEQVQSESTGELWTVSQNAWWATGPQGPGYYREVPGGGYEQLEVVGQ